MTPRNVSDRHEPAAPRIPISEQLLIDALPELNPTRVLCTSAGRGQFAGELKQLFPDARITCHYFDIYLADEARLARPEDISIVCAGDLPAEEVDLVAFALKASGDAELTHVLLQTGHVV